MLYFKQLSMAFLFALTAVQASDRLEQQGFPPVVITRSCSCCEESILTKKTVAGLAVTGTAAYLLRNRITQAAQPVLRAIRNNRTASAAIGITSLIGAWAMHKYFSASESTENNDIVQAIGAHDVAAEMAPGHTSHDEVIPTAPLAIASVVATNNADDIVQDVVSLILNSVDDQITKQAMLRRHGIKVLPENPGIALRKVSEETPAMPVASASTHVEPTIAQASESIHPFASYTLTANNQGKLLLCQDGKTIGGTNHTIGNYKIRLANGMITITANSGKAQTFSLKDNESVETFWQRILKNIK